MEAKPYSVFMTPSSIGGWHVRVTAPDGTASEKHHYLKEDGQSWAKAWADWHRTREPDEEYEL